MACSEEEESEAKEMNKAEMEEVTSPGCTCDFCNKEEATFMLTRKQFRIWIGDQCILKLHRLNGERIEREDRKAADEMDEGLGGGE